MKTSKFRVVPLSTEVAETARRIAAAGAADHVLVVADDPRGYPCRHCLRWAQPGEPMVLFPFAAIPAGPYSETGPIFVHEKACSRYSLTDEFPPDLRDGRAFRAYNADHNIIDAVIPNGDKPEAIVGKLLQNRETLFVDARSVTRGCFTFRIERI